MPARISLAGRIVVAVDDQRVDERHLPGAQARLVLSLLVCQRDRPVTREELADNLWPEERPESWSAALRGVVGRVRGFLVGVGLGDRDVVRAGTGGWHLHLPDDVWVDLERAGSQADEAERALQAGDPRRAGSLADGARAVLARPLLPGVEAPWLDVKRRELSLELLRTLDVLAEARLALGDHAHAATAAEQSIAVDAFRESAHRLLIRAHAAAGNHAAGLRAFERCRRLLAEELGADPAPQTQALHAELLQAAVPVATRAAGPAGPAETALAAPAGADDPGGPRAPTAPVCPYQGLRTYEEADADRFFGRSGDVARLLDRLDGGRFLAVVGPSGSGKSSLVRAGLVPALRRGELPGSDTWAVAVLRPGADPAATLGRTLAQAVDAGTVVLVVDQLEEAFTVCDDPSRRAAFLDALADLATAQGSRVVTIATLRADFYPRVAEHPRLADLVDSRQLLVTPMDEIGLAEAVAGPAATVGLRAGEGLVEAVLAGVLGRTAALPLASHCLVEVWERRAGDTLTLEAYRAVGGVDGALARRAEAVYAALAPTERAVARRILLRLAQPGVADDGQHPRSDTRRRVALDEVDVGPRETIEAVVARFTDARLLSAGGPPEEGPWLELAHEALIAGWPRLRGWIADDRAGLRVQRRLTAAAYEWERLGRDDGALYRGAPLAEVQAWAARHPDEANPLEAAFLEASAALETSDRRKRLTRLRLVVASLAVGLVAVAGLAATALVERGRAEEQERLARSRALAAEAVNQLAIEPALGLTLAVEAFDAAPTREAVAAVRQALVTPRPAFAVPGGRRDFDVDPGGRRLVVGDNDGTARIWDARSGAPLHTLGGHDGAVYVSTFSPDGSLLATADEEGVRIWDVAGGGLRHALPHGTTVLAAEWTDDGARLVTAAGTERVRVWDAAAGALITAVDAPQPVSLVRLAPGEEAAVALGAVDADLYVLDLTGASAPVVLRGHDGPAADARVGPDGRHAVSVGLDATARLWDLGTGEQLAVLEGFGEATWVGRFSHDGTRVLVGDATGRVRVASVPDGDTVFELPAHTGAVVDAAFGPGDDVAATVSTDGTAVVWDVDTGRPRATLRLDGAASLGLEARSVAFGSDGEHLYTRAASVQAWPVPDGPVLTLDGHERTVIALAVSDDGTRLASGGREGSARVWDLASGAEISALEVPASVIAAVAFSPDGAELATANPAPSAVADTTAPPAVWDVASGALLRSLAVPAAEEPPCPRTCQTGWVTYRPDGGALLTAGQDGMPRLWDARTGEEIRALDPAGRWVRAATFSPDGRWVAGAAWAGVPVWDARTGEIVRELPAPGLAVAFSQDGELLAVGGDDGVASLWDVASGRLAGELRHPSGVTGLAWSGDGRFLVTASGEGTALWDVASQQRIGEFIGPSHAVAFTPSEDIVAATPEGAVLVHRCTVCGSTDELLALAREQATRSLTPAERERHLLDEAPPDVDRRATPTPASD